MVLNSKLQVNTHYLAISAVIVALYDVYLNLGVGSIVVPNFLFSHDVTQLICFVFSRQCIFGPLSEEEYFMPPLF